MSWGSWTEALFAGTFEAKVKARLRRAKTGRKPLFFQPESFLEDFLRVRRVATPRRRRRRLTDGPNCKKTRQKWDLKNSWNWMILQAFLDFRGFDFRDFRFTAVYNSILFSSPLVLLRNLTLLGFCFCGFMFVSPNIQRKWRNACISLEVPLPDSAFENSLCTI
jgi:hypothetical protein